MDRMTERTRAQIRVIVLLLVAIVVQNTLGADMRVGGVAPDLMLLLAICGGFYGGARQGVLVGFACGLLSDLFLTNTPFGLAALTFCLLGYAIGGLRETLVPEGWVLVPIVVFAGSVVGVLAFVAFGNVVGETQLGTGAPDVLIRTVVIESFANTVLSLPVAWLYDRCSRGTEGAAEVARGSAERAVSL